MSRFLRRVRGALGLGLVWAVSWGALFAAIVSVIKIVDPGSVDEGEGPLRIAALTATVGFVSGVAFGALLSFAESRRKLLEFPLWRAALWGAIASAALPLLTPMNNQILFNTVPIGALVATATVALARRGARRDAQVSARTDPAELELGAGVVEDLRATGRESVRTRQRR